MNKCFSISVKIIINIPNINVPAKKKTIRRNNVVEKSLFILISLLLTFLKINIDSKPKSIIVLRYNPIV
ncbi:hypothetical protein GCM10027442_14760 [Emticicia fontis]